MKLDKNGAIISSVTGAQTSLLGNDYIVMWDGEGMPIHIHKSVIEYLCTGLYGPRKAPNQPPAPAKPIPSSPPSNNNGIRDDGKAYDDLFLEPLGG